MGLFKNPIYDNAVLPVTTTTLYSKGPINPTDMIIGANTYDDANIWDDDYIEAADVVLPQLQKDARDAYSIDKYDDSSVGAFAQFSGDIGFNCPSRQIAQIASSSIDGNIYNYLFGFLSDYDYAKIYLNVTDPAWMSHTAENIYVFGNPAAQPFSNSEKPFSEKDKILNKEIMSRWANFARSGNPSASSSEEEWLPVVPASDNSSDINANVGVDPRYLYITGDGGMMVQSNKAKMEQCEFVTEFFMTRFDSNGDDASDSDSDSDSDKNNTNNYDSATTNKTDLGAATNEKDGTAGTATATEDEDAKIDGSMEADTDAEAEPEPEEDSSASSLISTAAAIMTGALVTVFGM